MSNRYNHANRRHNSGRDTGVTLTPRGRKVAGTVAGVAVAGLLGGGLVAGHKGMEGYEASLQQQAIERIDAILIGTVHVGPGANYRSTPVIKNGDNTSGERSNILGQLPEGSVLEVVNPLVTTDSQGDTWMALNLPEQNEPTASTEPLEASEMVWMDVTALMNQDRLATIDNYTDKVDAQVRVSADNSVQVDPETAVPQVSAASFVAATLD